MKVIGVVKSALGCAVLAGSAQAQVAPVLDRVDWHRDLDKARGLAKETGRPLLLTFR